MSINPVMEAIHAAFNLEIANQFTVKGDTLLVTMPDQSRIVIGVEQIKSATAKTPHQSTATHNAHTYHYMHQHDFGYENADDTQPLERLLLQSIEDCRSYLDDVCHTLLNAEFRDFEVTLTDGTVYLITFTNA